MAWITAFHIIFMVTWFAGLFYLPRLFVYHADCKDKTSKERFIIMERKLFIIMTIGGIGTAIFGVLLLVFYAWQTYSHQGWLHTKLLLVTLLVAYHIYCGKLVKDFKYERNSHSHKFYRWVNEFPAIMLLFIIILVVVKPF